MGGEWQHVEFGSLAVLVRDTVDPNDARGLRYLGLEHIAQGSLRLAGVGRAEDVGSTKLRFKKGDILFGKLRPYFRKVVRAPFDGVGSTDIWVVRPRAGVEAGYLFYLMTSDLFLEPVIRASEGTRMPRAQWEYAAKLALPLPPLPEQRAIAHILGTLDDRLHAKGGECTGMRRVFDYLLNRLVSGAWSVREGQVWLDRVSRIVEPIDDKIELNRRMSETLEAMARALFQSWFVDFDPVRAKMEGRWRRGQSLPGLPAHLYDLFPDRLVPSELGLIPEGWEVVRLTDLIDVNPPRPSLQGLLAPYVDMASMPTRGHSPAVVVKRAVGSGMRFVNGDTLVARITPCLENGKTAFVDFLGDGEVGWGSTEFIVLRARSPLPEEFAYCLARSEGFREFAIQSMTGSSGRQRVQADSLVHFRLPRVPAPAAQAFGSTIKPLFARSSAATNESRTLAALRDALLPKLISGEIRVRDAERFLEERGL